MSVRLTPPARRPPTEAALQPIRDLVRLRTGVVLGPDQDSFVVSRLVALARKEGIDGWAEILDRIQAQPFGSLLDKVVDAMVVNETSFFRDGHPFDFLHRSVFPQLCRDHRDPSRLRIWSAACASGQEAYSVAIALREYFGRSAFGEPPILATDVSRTVIERARAGRFSDREIRRGLTPDRVSRHFTRCDDDWVVRDDTRDLVRFSHCNLTASFPLGNAWDVILLRNVLIYFDPATKARVLRRVGQVLRPNGVLILGSAETIPESDGVFSVDHRAQAGCYRRSAQT